MIEQHCSSTVCNRQEPVFCLGHSPCPQTQTLDTVARQPHTAPVCGAVVSTLAILAITWIYYSITDPGWMKGWVVFCFFSSILCVPNARNRSSGRVTMRRKELLTARRTTIRWWRTSSLYVCRT